MKKITSVVAVGVLLLAGCSQNEQPTQQNPEKGNTQLSQNPVNLDKNAPSKETPVPYIDDTTVKISDLTFKLPPGWITQKVVKDSNGVSTWEVAQIGVPDPKYHVTIPVQVGKSTHTIDKEDKLLKETDAGVKIYNNDCAPAIACYFVTYKDVTYEVTFGEPQSDQPVPPTLDGVWFPDTTVKADDTLKFVESLQ